jgi:hypothetical protein
VSPVKYELGFYISEGDILHSHRRENLKSSTFFLSEILNERKRWGDIDVDKEIILK